MPRCARCRQMYTGVYHMDCPAQRRAPERQPAPSAHPPKTALAANTASSHVGGPARPGIAPAQNSAPQRQPTTQPPSPAVRQSASAPAQQPPLPALPQGTGPFAPLPPGTLVTNPQQMPAAAVAAAPTAVPLPGNGRRGIITSITPGQARRPANGPAAAAMLGAGLLILAIGMAMPCLVILALLGAYFLRRTLFRLALPGGTVSTWNCVVYDQAQSISFSALILDPEGMPPEVGAQVLVRGRQRARYFGATEIIREADARGNPVPIREGLIARQVPPAWLGYGLLALGFLALLPFWLAMIR